MSLLKKLNALAAEHAQKYDPAVSTEAPSSEQKPLYFEDLEARAKREGKTPDEIYIQDQALLARDEFPSAQCLKPGEVLYAVFLPDKLAAVKRDHVRTCLYCQSLVAHSKADEKKASAIARELARVAPVPGGSRENRVSHWLDEAHWPDWGQGLRIVIGFAQPVMAGAFLVGLVVLGLFPAARTQFASLLAPRSTAESALLTRTGGSSAVAHPLDLQFAVNSLLRDDNQTARKKATDVLTLDPGNVDAYRVRAVASLRLNDFLQAKSDYGTISKLDPKNDKGSLPGLSRLSNYEMWGSFLGKTDNSFAYGSGSLSDLARQYTDGAFGNLPGPAPGATRAAAPATVGAPDAPPGTPRLPGIETGTSGAKTASPSGSEGPH